MSSRQTPKKSSSQLPWQIWNIKHTPKSTGSNRTRKPSHGAKGSGNDGWAMESYDNKLNLESVPTPSWKSPEVATSPLTDNLNAIFASVSASAPQRPITTSQEYSYATYSQPPAQDYPPGFTPLNFSSFSNSSSTGPTTQPQHNRMNALSNNPPPSAIPPNQDAISRILALQRTNSSIQQPPNGTTFDSSHPPFDPTKSPFDNPHATFNPFQASPNKYSYGQQQLNEPSHPPGLALPNPHPAPSQLPPSSTISVDHLLQAGRQPEQDRLLNTQFVHSNGHPPMPDQNMPNQTHPSLYGSSGYTNGTNVSSSQAKSPMSSYTNGAGPSNNQPQLSVWQLQQQMNTHSQKPVSLSLSNEGIIKAYTPADILFDPPQRREAIKSPKSGNRQAPPPQIFSHHNYAVPAHP